MTPPMDVQPNGQRQQRRGRKPNGSQNHTQATTAASPSDLKQYTVPAQHVYDGSSEPTPSPTMHRKNRKQGHHMSEPNNYPSSENFQNHTNRQRGPSVSYPIPPVPSHGTPVKSAAYAGPTFHASPAASSLPIPKMFSKSLPDSEARLPPHLVAEDSDFAQTDSDDSRPTTSFTPDPKDREPSPLDFLFDAARQARSSSFQTQSLGYNSGKLTPTENRPASGSATPTNRSGALFPIELDGNTTPTNSIGPAFATPYKERMSAYQSRDSSGYNSETGLDTKERVAKAEGLKKLLGHSPSPKPTPPPPAASDQYRPLPQRQSSGPNTPNRFVPSPGLQARQSPSTFANGDFPFRDIISQRPPSSKLRQEVSPPTYSSPSAPPALYGTPSPSRTPQAMDTKRMEDDLRRVLKLDALG